MKNGKQWAKGKPRGETGWKREGSCLSVQWIDNKIVAMLSIIDDANEYFAVDRKVKVNDKRGKVEVKKTLYCWAVQCLYEWSSQVWSNFVKT